MTMIADVLLAAGALGAALYCYVLSRRLRRFTDLEKGVGGAVAVLSVQVDELTDILTKAQSAAKESVTQLDAVSARAEVAHKKLELSIAAMHDVPQPAEQSVAESPFFVRRAAEAEAK
ncbi:hypothetical protein BC777_2467 [Yoonia maricola]|uniref:Uncharacterized protein n=1 Tax=Yoonia maricola TaxID=420999 RepID=A0A2M8W5B7_9RHOB|nr:hypothetical protein [Yoonia maricola]PJI86109.1 hypothetical protein BC777_2467 [Yoonia maricola]